MENDRDKKFSYSLDLDEERYGSLYGSVEEALKDAIAEIEALRKSNASDIPEKFFVGRCQTYKPTLLGDGNNIIKSVKLEASNLRQLSQFARVKNFGGLKD